MEMEKSVGDTTERWLEWKCVFCKQDLKDSSPKLLPCFHGGCSVCIFGDEQPKNNSDLLKCPVCQQDFRQCDVIDNYFIKEMPSSGEGSTNENSTTQTPSCTSCEDNETASSFCTDCGEWLCDACVQAHQRVRVTKDHTIQCKSDVESGLSSGAAAHRQLFCPAHKQEPLKLFCETCDQLTCRDCQLSGHRDHKYQFSNDACTLQKGQLQILVRRLADRKNNLQRVRDVSLKSFKDLDDREQCIRESIKQFAMKFISEIGQRSRQLVKDLHTVCDQKKAELSASSKDLATLIAKMEHNIKFVESALEQGSDLALLYSKRMIYKQLQHLQMLPYEFPSQASEIDLRFVYEQQNLTHYIRRMGSLMVADRATNTLKPVYFPNQSVESGPGQALPSAQGAACATNTANSPHPHTPTPAPPPPPYLSQHPQAPRMHQNPQMTMSQGNNYPAQRALQGLINYNSNALSPNQLVSSTSQSNLKQQNTHLWNLLESNASAPPPLIHHHPSNYQGQGGPQAVTNIRPCATFMPPNEVAARNQQQQQQQGHNAHMQQQGQQMSANNMTLQKMLAMDATVTKSGSGRPIVSHVSTYVPLLPRPPSGTNPAIPNNPNHNPSVTPNISIIPLSAEQRQAQQQAQQQHQHQLGLQQRQQMMQQQHFYNQLAAASGNNNSQTQPPHSPSPFQGNQISSNILVSSGTQRLSHYPQQRSSGGVVVTNSLNTILPNGSVNVRLAPSLYGSPQVLLPSDGTQVSITSTAVRPPASTSSSPSSSLIPWAPSPQSINNSSQDGESSQDRILRSAKKDSSSQQTKQNANVEGVSIKVEKKDDTPDYSIEMATKVLNDFCKDSMDVLLASLRTDTSKEAAALLDELTSDIAEQSQKQKPDSSSSPEAANVTSISETNESDENNKMVEKPSSSQSESKDTDPNLESPDVVPMTPPPPKSPVIVTLDDDDVDPEMDLPKTPKPVDRKLPSSDDPNEDWCAVCHDGGELLCCGKCPRVYHLECHVPSLPSVAKEEDNWQCLMCMDVESIPNDEVDIGGKRKAESGLYGKELKLCQRILLEMFCHDASPPFHEPVCSEDVPGYDKVVTHPMDLETVKSKLAPDYFDHYSSTDEFFHDMRLIFSNCFLFNEIDSELYIAGKILEEFLNQLLTKFFPNYLPSLVETEVRPRIKRKGHV